MPPAGRSARVPVKMNEVDGGLPISSPAPSQRSSYIEVFLVDFWFLAGDAAIKR